MAKENFEIDLKTRVTPTQDQRLQRLADDRVTKKATLVRQAIQEYLTREDPDYASAARIREDEPEPKVKPAKKLAAKRKAGQLRDIAAVSLNLYGMIGAGPALMPGSRPIGTVPAPKDQRFPRGTFAAGVGGDSMSRAGIQPGDRVALQWREDREPEPGDIVVAHIYGDGSVLKRLVERGGLRWLASESHNAEHGDICLDCDGEPLAEIQAVFICKLPAPANLKPLPA